MSFTGTPSTKTAIFRWSNPRIDTRASPTPPPCSVAYAPGVELRTIGKSLVPNSSAICLELKVENAIGVSRAFAISAFTTTSSINFSIGDSVRSIFKAVLPA